MQATLLDPRFKQRVFSSASSVALTKQMLIVAYKRLEDQEEESATTVTKCASMKVQTIRFSWLCWLLQIFINSRLCKH